MIHFTQNVFHLNTQNTSYLMEVLPSGHLSHLYYGKGMKAQKSYDYLKHRFTTPVGNSTDYDLKYPYSLDTIPLELATAGKGDYKTASIGISYPDGSDISDFIYQTHQIIDGALTSKDLPLPFQNEDRVKTLIVNMVDQVKSIKLQLIYNLYFEKDIITRQVKVINESQETVEINKIMSFNMDFQSRQFDLISLDGKWIKERHINRHPLREGIFVIDSKRGVSSSTHSPFMVLLDKNATERQGQCYGYSLMYSGNHMGLVEVSAHDITRIQMGIQVEHFKWHLKPEDRFESPVAVMTFSDQGLNKMSHHFHHFINKNIISKQWQYKSRPVLINNWEATYFDFDEGKLKKLAKSAAQLGIELFVLDDGWFGKRNDDKTSLGDWLVNKKKLPKGLKSLSRAIHDLKMDFGIWVEPEMVSVESDLYKKHPEWAVMLKDRRVSFGRNQLLLDLSNPQVIDYLEESLTNLFKEANVQYVKWDMNRNFSDWYSNYLPAERQGEFHHRYVLGLYDLLTRLTETFPDILFESCSSGGNRFDLGMLKYMPQTWTSDNTDGYERQKIQYGTSLLFPLSTMGAHVSAVPSHQVLRNTPLETRFNVAMFGVLGYELDVTQLSKFEKKVIQEQIEFYKNHRKLLQFGQFSRLQSPFENNQMAWIVQGDDAIVGHYQKLQEANGPLDLIYLQDLDLQSIYHVKARKQYMNIKAFGNMINHVSPVKMKAEGIVHTLVSQRYMFEMNGFENHIPGDVLMHAGLRLNQQFMGTGYDETVNHLGDFGSRVYTLSKS